MRWARWIPVVLAIVLGGIASARWSLLAQDRAAKVPIRAREASPRSGSSSVQDALLRPLDLPFGEETTLEAVREYLTKSLGAPVVLDRAALDRLELMPEDTVQLDLRGVRLKLGLKLLLDQVGMTYRVEPEDNLLVLTDPESGGDVSDRMISEVKSLHRDLHDLQDAVDDLRDLVEEELGYEPDTEKELSTRVKFDRARARRPRPNTNRARTGGVAG